MIILSYFCLIYSNFLIDADFGFGGQLASHQSRFLANSSPRPSSETAALFIFYF